MKVVIWGYPLNSHTHSYIHSSFYKAFKHLGHDVYWFHDDEYPEDFDFDDCIFLTEGFADKNIPLKETSTYYVHVCVNPNKYLGKVKKLIDVRYLQESMDNDNYDFVLDRDNCTELDAGVLYDNKFANSDYEVIYCGWGTDLLPHEIDFDWVNYPREKKYYFIGSTSSEGRFANAHLINEFAGYCKEIGIDFRYINPWTNPVTDEENRWLVQRSFMSPDFRNETHHKWGYLACRLVKSISYGHVGITNSPINAKFIDDTVICKPTVREMFDEGMKYKDDKELIRHQMEVVKFKHTYVNRVNGMLKVL